MDLPKPRADQVSTAYPRCASRCACSRTLFLLPPNPCPSNTAGARPPPTGGKKLASSVTR